MFRFNVRMPSELPSGYSGIRNNPLQNKYREKINNGWTEKRADKIFIDFYNNLKMGSNQENLNYIFDKLLENNIQHLSKIRIFDILWWSYLKAEKLRVEKGINWNTIGC